MRRWPKEPLFVLALPLGMADSKGNFRDIYGERVDFIHIRILSYEFTSDTTQQELHNKRLTGF
jgi:hypothetical protein